MKEQYVQILKTLKNGQQKVIGEVSLRGDKMSFNGSASLLVRYWKAYGIQLPDGRALYPNDKLAFLKAIPRGISGSMARATEVMEREVEEA
jgi:hypothetical protein